MAITNRERIGNGLDHLARGLRPFVEREMKSSAGDHWLSPLGCRASRPTEPTGGQDARPPQYQVAGRIPPPKKKMISEPDPCAG